MQFRLQVDCDNAVFKGDPDAELSRILAELARCVGSYGAVAAGNSGRLRDINGNDVGAWSFVGEG